MMFAIVNRLVHISPTGVRLKCMRLCLFIHWCVLHLNLTPILTPILFSRPATIDGQNAAGDGAGLLRAQEQDHVGHLINGDQLFGRLRK